MLVEKTSALTYCNAIILLNLARKDSCFKTVLKKTCWKFIMYNNLHVHACPFAIAKPIATDVLNIPLECLELFHYKLCLPCISRVQSRISRGFENLRRRLCPTKVITWGTGGLSLKSCSSPNPNPEQAKSDQPPFKAISCVVQSFAQLLWNIPIYFQVAQVITTLALNSRYIRICETGVPCYICQKQLKCHEIWCCSAAIPVACYSQYYSL